MASESPTVSPGRKQKPDRDHGSDREDFNPTGLEIERIETNGMGSYYAA